MREDDRPYDAPHSSRTHLAELLEERRVHVSNDVVARLEVREGVRVSPLIVRTLVHALAQSIAESMPDIVVHWSRMVRHAHSAALVVAMIDAACAAVEEFAQDDHGDLATIVVFLEIVKARAAAQILDDAPAASADIETASHTAIHSLLAVLRARDDAT